MAMMELIVLVETVLKVVVLAAIQFKMVDRLIFLVAVVGADTIRWAMVTAADPVGM